MFFNATDRLRRAVEGGAITPDDYHERIRALGTWLDERGAYAWPYRECGYRFFRNPSV